jgi:hypothetical protein
MSTSARATVAGLFMCLSVQVVSLSANASDELQNALAECRQEVTEYDIPPEQAAEYVDGCFMSKGGYPPSISQDSNMVTREAVSLPVGQPVNGINESLELPGSDNEVR